VDLWVTMPPSTSFLARVRRARSTRSSLSSQLASR
jgi:hypothetical protein